MRRWTVADGLPANQVTVLDEDSLGRLWIASYSGLICFDGHTFTVYHAGNSDLPSSRITALHVDREGTVWAGLTEGSLVSFSGESFQVRARMPPSTGVFRGLAMDSKGVLWIGTVISGDQPALWKFENEQLTAATRLEELLLSAQKEEELELDVQGIYLTPDPDGDVWVRVDASAVLRLGDGRLNPFGDRPAGRVSSRSPHPWQFELAPGKYQLMDHRGGRLAFLDVGTDRLIWLVDQQGNVWAIDNETLFRYRLDQVGPPEELELGGYMESMLEDSSGNIWVSTWAGLIRLRPNPFQVLRAPSDRVPYEVLEHADKTLSVVEELNGRGCNHRIEWSESQRPFISEECGSFMIDQRGTGWSFDGKAWVGKRTNAPDLRLPFAGNRIYSDPTQPDVVWIAQHKVTKVAPYHPDGPRLMAEFDLGQEPRLVWDRNKGLWAVSVTGLYRFENDVFHRYSREDGLPVDHVRCLHQDRGGNYWIGTYSGGLARFAEGEFQVIGVRDGLLDDVVSSILEDDFGNFWMAGNRGIQRVKQKQLVALLEGEIERIDAVLYGVEIGVEDPATMGRPALRSSDGSMWFPTLDGMVHFEPAEVLRRAGPPPTTVIEKVVTSAGEQPPSSVVRVQGLPRRVTVHYVGVDLSSPLAVRYQHRLEEVDGDWVDAEDSRQVTYNNLPPGQHRFRVKSRGASGEWGADEASVVIEVLPFFHETNWFLALLLAGVSMAILGMVRLRTRQLRRATMILEQKVNERTQDLLEEKQTVERQARQLKRLDQAKSRFFAEVSHEFRTPLTLILGSLEDLRLGQDSYGVLNPEGRQRLSQAEHNSERLLALVEQLLDVARADSNKLELRRRKQDFTLFLRRIADSFGSLAKLRGIDFRVHTSLNPVVFAFDEVRLETVLNNLLANAFKFVPSGGLVRLESRLIQQDSDEQERWLRIEVEDNGPGIPPDELPQIFERFYQTGNLTSWDVPGAGLGLALVREFVQLHDGTVRVNSEVGQGTLFTVELPLVHDLGPDPEEHPEPDRAAALKADQQPRQLEVAVEPSDPSTGTSTASVTESLGEDVPTLLVADDSPEIRSYVRSHLGKEYRVLEAGDGQQALALIREELPDLVVTDVMMPNLDGFELCRCVKTDPETDFVPLILLTARATTDSRVEGLELGADDYLVKPFKMRELQVRISNLISSRRRLQRRYEQVPEATSSTEETAEPSTESAFESRLRQVIESRLHEEEFGVDALATELGVSRASLYRHCKEAQQMTPSDYLWQLRLARAAELLQDPDNGVSEVAYAVGFRSVAHFSQRFKQHFGCTPSSLRRSE